MKTGVLAAFNWSVAAAFVIASVTNLSIRSESFGLYLAAYPLMILSMAFLPSSFADPRGAKSFDGFSIAFVLLTMISAFLHPNTKSATYVALYLFSVVFLGVLLRNALALFGWRDFIHRTNALGCGIISLIAIAEFLSRYFDGTNPLGWLPFVNAPLAVCGLDVPRSYALSVEPTYLAWYLSTLGTIAIWYVWASGAARPAKLLYTFLLAMALTLTWSTSAMIAIPCAAVAVALYMLLFDRLRFAPSFTVNAVIIAVAVAVTLAVTLSSSSLAPCLNYVGMKPLSQALYGERDVFEEVKAQRDALLMRQKLALASGDQSEMARINAALAATNNSLAQLETDEQNALSRYQIWERDLSKSLEHLWFGWGPGYNSASGNSSSLNLFVAVLLENGALALMALTLFLLSVALHIARSAVPAKYVFLFAYFAGCLHLMTQTRFFFPYVWLLIGLFWMEERRAIDRRSSNHSLTPL
jgi:hypothetical protein